jgi:hypothetical protein
VNAQSVSGGPHDGAEDVLLGYIESGELLQLLSRGLDHVHPAVHISLRDLGRLLDRTGRMLRIRQVVERVGVTEKVAEETLRRLENSCRPSTGLLDLEAIQDVLETARFDGSTDGAD